MAKITFAEKYYIHSCVITGLLFLFYLLWVNNSFLYSSILDYKNIVSDTFDGTVYPIEFAPSPILLTYEQRKQSYETIDSKYFIKTPQYNPKIFGKDLDNLSPGSKDYYEVITQRLIYTVPYIGSYNFDYKEFAWSHPGVDIVVPEWTPVRNIANWVVVDIWNQPGGFWNYVLIKHNWVPLPDGSKGNVYSLYAHMLRGTVEIGTKVKKWQLIWYVWQTGTATTPHLHFQMDLEGAPYSPYWPFSTLDMKLAWVWFFEGVNIGLGKENAMRYTINPLKFVNDHFKQSISNPPLLVGSEKDDNDLKQEEVKEENKQDTRENTLEKIETKPLEIIKDDEISVSKKDVSLSTDIVIDNDSQIVKREQLVTKNVELLSTISPEIVLADNAVLKGFDKNNLLALDNDDLSESLEKVDDTISSPTLDISYPVIDPNDHNVLTGVQIESKTEKLDITQSWNVLSQPEMLWDNDFLFKDITQDYKYFKELKYLKEKWVVVWFVDETFRPKSDITRAESLKMILLAFGVEPIKDQFSQFKDVATQSWENTYINAAIKNKIISIQNTSFFPMRNVSRIEWLKLVLLLSWKKIEINDEDKKEIKDMESTHWASNYVQYALKNNLLSLENGNIYPDKPLTREEIISILYYVLEK